MASVTTVGWKNALYAIDVGRDRGRIQVGQLADFVVLSDDALPIDTDGIRNLRVTATVIGGEIVCENSNVDETPPASPGVIC